MYKMLIKITTFTNIATAATKTAAATTAAITAVVTIAIRNTTTATKITLCTRLY
jgi:hypothetical protein